MANIVQEIYTHTAGREEKEYYSKKSAALFSLRFPFEVEQGKRILDHRSYVYGEVALMNLFLCFGEKDVSIFLDLLWLEGVHLGSVLVRKVGDEEG